MTFFFFEFFKKLFNFTDSFFFFRTLKKQKVKILDKAVCISDIIYVFFLNSWDLKNATFLLPISYEIWTKYRFSYFKTIAAVTINKLSRITLWFTAWIKRSSAKTFLASYFIICPHHINQESFIYKYVGWIEFYPLYKVGKSCSSCVGLQDCSKWVQTPVELLCLLLD